MTRNAAHRTPSSDIEEDLDSPTSGGVYASADVRAASRRRVYMIGAGVAIAIAVLVTIITATAAARGKASPLEEEVSDAPSVINKYDLWGVHDLLLAGYACPACNALQNGRADATRRVEAATVALARLLSDIHPVRDCRVQIAEAIAAVGVKATGEQVVDAAAAASWTCLDPAATCNSSAPWFCTVADFSAYGVKMENLPKGFANAADPPVFFKDRTAACAAPTNTQWNRACSYWASLHALSMRADAVGKGYAALEHLVPVMTSGALLCQGCTRHYMLFVKDVLESDAVGLSAFTAPKNGPLRFLDTDTTEPTGPITGLIEDGGHINPWVPCFLQCGLASKHTNVLIRCIAARAAGAACESDAIAAEATSLLGLRKVLGDTVAAGRLTYPLNALLSIHHDLVTEGVAQSAPSNGETKYFNFPQKSYYTPSRACAMLKMSPVFSGDTAVAALACTAEGTREAELLEAVGLSSRLIE